MCVNVWVRRWVWITWSSPSYVPDRDNNKNLAVGRHLPSGERGEGKARFGVQENSAPETPLAAPFWSQNDATDHAR